MYRRYFILTILLVPLFLTPVSVAARLELNSSVGIEGPLIESRLRMEVQTSSTVASALLEFEDPLTPTEILRAESLGVNFVKRGSSIVNVGRIYSVEVRDIGSLEAISDLGLIRATSGTKQYVPSISSSVPAIGADDVWTNLNKDGGDVNGSGVTVAVLDTGALWTHPSFWRASPGEYQTIDAGTHYYVDLDGDLNEDPGEGPIDAVNTLLLGLDFDYASKYMYINVDGIGDFNYASGDRWIGGIDANDDNVITFTVESVVLLDVPKVAILYDQENSNVYVRGVNLTQAVSVIDHEGHGTHVASTVAGGQVGMTSYVGVAPGADLIIIKSELQSADILDGISFAIENEADIINMSFSSYLGFLDGTDLEDIAVSEAFLRYGVMTVSAAGNLADKDKHARFSVATGGQGNTMLSVSNAPDYSFLSLLWHSSDSDEHVILTPPVGEPIDLGVFSEIAQQSWALDEATLSAYVFADVSVRGLNNVIVQISTDDHVWENGIWNVTVTNDSGELIWIDGFAWDGQWGSTNMYFQTAVDSGRTISSPGTADHAVTVAAYSEASSGIMISSSRGPRIDGTPKPTVAAPGYSIRAAQNSVAVLWTSRDGTSMASPHVAGVLALIRQASGKDSSWLDYSALVNGAGGQTSHFEAASISWGHGLTDALWSVIQVLDSPGVDGTTISDWYGVSELFGDSTDLSVNGGHDITAVKSFLDNGTISLAISMRDVPDFQGTDILGIGWDTDSNISTGQNGADIVVNVTGGSAEVFEWTGSSYVASSLVSHWWTDSTSVILRLEGIILGTRGIISVSTHNSTMNNIDQAGPGSLTDILLPVMDDLWLEYNDESMIVHLKTNDRDTSMTLRTVAWSVVNGPLEILNSSSRVGESEFIITIPENLISNDYLNSIAVNITSESFTLFLPLVLLSTQIGRHLQFTITTLDRDVVRVGILLNDLITGELVLEGYTLASLVYIAFHSESGSWLNFTLSSSTGIYDIEISPSHFQLGSHEVYAIAIGQSVPGTELNFATLTVVQDYTVLAVGAALIIVGCGIMVILRRRRGDMI
ncbi:MAG: S8 family serine peptidase [Candidatus Thorarchaeota archaeon]|jgi:subtilisin family serine protease